ncbi:hypothetical protein TTHERM_00249630 (macronuclear) [Tetrahymena thermophila SB210]|uniref:Uncharacterized protein n=1 Tax=Tetrahymena thermophila (strain SB210) TaxID=312017 RepID=Q23QX0_TETTS|nr:hypothetical protein TTHERM_00249630 [Tetrahymena thermophila SB210]EAR98768.1 hypothetical protein TTHERM_00249630 [Tetrahymena thermophila SB210]|eukprot:XP_001019013.1 hypothetical protein TTHERM_00249630 [Tetrahymena thermophila SB210]
MENITKQKVKYFQICYPLSQQDSRDYRIIYKQDSNNQEIGKKQDSRDQEIRQKQDSRDYEIGQKQDCMDEEICYKQDSRDQEIGQKENNSEEIGQKENSSEEIRQKQDDEFLEKTNTFYREEFEKINQNMESYHLFKHYIFDSEEIMHNTCLLLGTDFKKNMFKIYEDLIFDRRTIKVTLDDFIYYQAMTRRPHKPKNQEQRVAQQYQNFELRIIKSKKQNKKNLAKFILFHFLSREELIKIEKTINNKKVKNQPQKNESNKLTNYFKPQKQKINQKIDQKPFSCDSNTIELNEIQKNQFLQNQLPQQIGQQEPQFQPEKQKINQMIDQISIQHDFNTVKLNEIQNKQILEQQLPQEVSQQQHFSFSGLLQNQGLKQNEQNKLVENFIESENQQRKLSDLEIQYYKKFKKETFKDSSHQLEEQIKSLIGDLQQSQKQQLFLIEENQKISANANDYKLLDIIQKKNNQQDFCKIQQQLNIQNQKNRHLNNFNSENYNQFINRANQINQEQSQYDQQSNSNFNYQQSQEKQIIDLYFQICKVELENAEQKMKMFFTLYPNYNPQQNLIQQNNLHL